MGPVLSTGRVAGRRSAASSDRRHLSEGPTASQGRNPETQGAWLRQPLERHVEQRWSKDCGGICHPAAFSRAVCLRRRAARERDYRRGSRLMSRKRLEAIPLQLCHLPANRARTHDQNWARTARPEEPPPLLPTLRPALPGRPVIRFLTPSSASLQGWSVAVAAGGHDPSPAHAAAGRCWRRRRGRGSWPPGDLRMPSARRSWPG